MRSSSRANAVIALGLLAVFIAGAWYASFLGSWLKSSGGGQDAAAAKRQERLAAARADFRRDLLSPLAHLRLAEALFDAGRPVDGFYVMHAAKALFGEGPFLRAHAQVVLYKGTFFLGDQEFDPSPANEARLRKALQSDPSDPRALHYLARILAKRNENAEALRLLAGVGDDRGGLAFRAQLRSARGDLSAAIEDWTRLAAAHPGTHEARQALEELGALAARQQGDAPLMARDALDELLRQRPDDNRVFGAAAMAAWGRGDLGAVQAMAAEAERRKKGPHAGALMVQASLALQERDAEKALRFFTKAWEADAEDLYSAAKLSQLYHRQRADPEGALPYDLALYRRNPAYEDGGERVEKRILETLDERRRNLSLPGGAEGLSRLFDSDDASLRAEACARAAGAADARWIETLGERLDDDVELVRHTADYALFQSARRFPEAVRVRRDEWLGSDKPLARIRALNLFADLEPNETFPLVLRALRDPHPGVRFYARVMVLDHYYKELPAAQRARSEYLAAERDPQVLGLYARLPR